MPDRFEIKLTDDQSSVLIEATGESGEKITTRLDAQELLALIQELGKAHSQLIAERPVPPLKGQKIEGIFDTLWHVSPELMGEASALSFFHPFFGPVGFLVPIEQVEQMVLLLSDHIKVAKSLQEGPKN
ncbi:MAG TPA: hypothetical protein VME69_09230 [Methylocella sp.]|nr:hypothetical protein [Methylocella sp.]